MGGFEAARAATSGRPHAPCRPAPCDPGAALRSVLVFDPSGASPADLRARWRLQGAWHLKRLLGQRGRLPPFPLRPPAPVGGNLNGPLCGTAGVSAFRDHLRSSAWVILRARVKLQAEKTELGRQEARLSPPCCRGPGEVLGSSPSVHRGPQKGPPSDPGSPPPEAGGGQAAWAAAPDTGHGPGHHEPAT